MIRRASEIAARDAEGGEGDLPEAEVYRIAREVGLGEKYVRRALSEVQVEQHDGSFAGRLVGPGDVRTSRAVEGSPEELARRLDEFLVAGRLLQRVRRSPRFLQYRPSVDWISQLSRAASGTSKKYFVASARSVEVRLEPVDDDQTLVELDVDPGIQGDYLGGTLAAAGFGGLGAGVGIAVSTATVVPAMAAIALGTGVGAGIIAGTIHIARSMYRRKMADVRAEVEGVLDRLEMGEELEPPPSSWRRWVEKHFHGARRMLDTYDDDWSGA
ncbi:hypothetical protein [Gaopeijia maritima]|uniref:Uncharacterized protein n=1 Tax=Gaopeijia maritima TaxID=3119007 RepID=A0ABU9E9N1_9BACT